MDMKNFIAGVNILLPFYDKPDGYHLGAEHDVIYLYATNKPLPEAKVAEMIELGFAQECWPVVDGERKGEYSADDGWYAYV